MTLIARATTALLLVSSLLGCGRGVLTPAAPPAPVAPAPTPAPTPAPPAPAPAPPTSSNPPADFPPGFWVDPTTIPAAQNVMMFQFLNRTNGKYPDSQVWWSVKINGAVTTHSIAEQSTFDMPANNSGRVYVYLGPGTDTTVTASPYFDFMEYDIGSNPPAFHGNTTRVDAFGIKLAMQLLCTDGYQVTVGENPATFAEDRASTFERFVNQVPTEYQHLAQVQAPYRILSPDAAFNAGGQYADYYTAYINQIWQSNGLTLPLAGPNASGLGNNPDLSAAIYRHVAGPGMFHPDGTLIDPQFWAHTPSASFYESAPANFYAQFWHQNAVNGLAYGFPYDDVGGYSSYISHDNPRSIQIAIGW
jgi:trimeric autotransporter adhesin